jgi:hypothetical protein
VQGAQTAKQSETPSDAADPVERKIDLARRAVETTPDERAETLLEKAIEHHRSSQALAKKGKTEQARKEALIAEKLADKALKLCSDSESQ